MKGNVAIVLVGVIMIIVEIVIMVNYMNFKNPQIGSMIILQFMILTGIGGALVSWGIKRRK